MGSENNMVAAREAAALAFDARARKSAHPATITMERHHAKVIRQGEGDDYDAVQAALIAIERLAQPDAQQGASSPASGKGDGAFRQWLRRYCGEQDPKTMRFGVGELWIAFANGEQAGAGAMKGALAEAIAPHINSRAAAIANSVTVPPLAAATQPAVPQEGETFASIVAWGDETFGIAADPDRIVERAWEEWREMIAEKPGTPERAIEAADVIIVLLRTPGILDAIEAKMTKNRARQWRLLGDGTGYHIPAALTGAGENGEQGA